jgi:hypothetical protein
VSGGLSSHDSHDRHDHQYRPPRDCPVCGAGLAVTRLSCGSCGSELSGVFESCDYCALTDADRELLRVFLVSRGNMRELERHLGVSYPTARQRYADLLAKLGLEPAAGEGAESASTAAESLPKASRVDILARLAKGELDVEAATTLLRGSD